MAANLASGHGFVYNPGEWHLGSTAALYGLLLAAFGWLFGPDRIPAISGVVSCASMFATGLMLPALGAADADPNEAARGRRAGVAAGLLYAASPLLFVTFGGEMPFLLALVDRRVPGRAPRTPGARRRPRRARRRHAARRRAGHRRRCWPPWPSAGRRWPWREGVLVAVAVLLPFLGLAWHAYGSPLPSTLPAKLAQRDSGLWGTFGRGLVDWLRLFLWDATRPNLGFAPVTPPTLWAVDRRRRRRRSGALRAFLPLLAWTAVVHRRLRAAAGAVLPLVRGAGGAGPVHPRRRRAGAGDRVAGVGRDAGRLPRDGRCRPWP